ncbi:MAG: tetratricopeptide repeat protein, partial [Methylocella sp.]
MTYTSGNRILRFCAVLAAAWAILQGGAFFAQAQGDPKAGQPADAGTPSTAPPVADPLPIPAWLGGAPDNAFAAYQRGNYVTAMREAMKRIEADPGDGPAMTLIGELYAQGLGVRRDTAEAARWYKLAAERSDRQAIFALGVANLKGEGVPRDRAGAAALFEQAAAQNHPGALYNLGVLAIENDGVTSDLPRAARLFRQSAELGYSDAAYALGLLYRNGTGFDKSDEQAAQWIGRAAKDDNVPAQVEYA